MLVNEIFYSLSGEGIHVGTPSVFVRLAGCNLDCDYCDTRYAADLEDSMGMTVYDIMLEVRTLKSSGWVLVTGGEPLVQEPALDVLVDRLKFYNYLVEIETNGSVDPPSWFRLVDSWSVDVKCPSSGPSYRSFRTKWLKKLRKQDQLKFVVGTQEDLNFVRSFLIGAKLKPTVLISPLTGILLDKGLGTIEEYWHREWLQECAEFCKEQNVRLSLQLHKILYGDRRGV